MRGVRPTGVRAGGTAHQRLAVEEFTDLVAGPGMLWGVPCREPLCSTMRREAVERQGLNRCLTFFWEELAERGRLSAISRKIQVLLHFLTEFEDALCTTIVGPRRGCILHTAKD